MKDGNMDQETLRLQIVRVGDHLSHVLLNAPWATAVDDYAA